ADSYSVMREPRPGDRIIHCVDKIIVGESIVGKPFQVVKERPPSAGKWAKFSEYYRIELRRYRRFRQKPLLSSILTQQRDVLLEEMGSRPPANYPFMTHGDT